MDLHKLPTRFILSIIAGIAVAMGLSLLMHELLYFAGIFPPLQQRMFDTGLVLIELLYHSIFVITGAMVTAHIARDKAKKAVVFFGTKEVIMWILGTILLWKHTPPWYNMTKAILGVPLAMLGGYIYSHIKDRNKQKKLSEPSKNRIL